MNDLSDWVRLCVTSLVTRARMSPQEAREFLRLLLRLCLAEEEYQLGTLEPVLFRILPTEAVLAPGSSTLLVAEAHASACIAVISRLAKKPREQPSRSISGRLLSLVGMGDGDTDTKQQQRDSEEMSKNFARLCDQLGLPQLPDKHGSEVLQRLKQAQQLIESAGEQSP